MTKTILIIITALLQAALTTNAQPVIFNHSETIRPGETFSLQGHDFGPAPVVWLNIVTADKKGTGTADSTSLHPGTRLVPTQFSINYAAVKLPAGTPQGLYAVEISNGTLFSKPIFINAARPVVSAFNEIQPGTTFSIYGRNLSFKNGHTRVTFIPNDHCLGPQSAPASGSEFEIQVTAPKNLVPGAVYKLSVNNGFGGKYGEGVLEDSVTVIKPAADPFALNVPWAAAFDFSNNIYNVKTDPRLKIKARGNGQSNDRAALQEAIDLAAVSGGVVYLPAGNYKLIYTNGSGLTMRSRVVIRGDGPAHTRVLYGYGMPFSTERVKAAYGWTLGWPDSRSEGMGMVWPGGISTSAVMDLTLKNVNESGSFLHTIKNMPEGGSRLAFKNCHFDLSGGWGMAMVNVNQLLLTGCVFKSSSLDVRNINAPTRTWPWDLKNSHNLTFSNNTTFYAAGRFGANGCHHAVFKDNTFIRDGDHQSQGETGGLSLDYTSQVVIAANTFKVTGASVKNANQGETILSQGGNAHQQNAGLVSRASPSSITDVRKEFQDLTDRISTDWQYAVHPANYTIAIVSGRGTGQQRLITGNNDTTIQIAKAWDVIPDGGSKYVVTQWSAQHMLILDNVLKDNNRGIWFYSGGDDVVISGNQLINSEGIYIRADQRLNTNRYNLTSNMYISNNKVINTDGKRQAYIAIWLAKNKTEPLFGTGTQGVEIKNNALQAFEPNLTKGSLLNREAFFNDGSETDTNLLYPGILGTIFENNTAIHVENPYQTGKVAAHTTIITRQPLSHLNQFSQENAEKQALQKYETANKPLDSMRVPSPAANEALFGAHLSRSATLLQTSSRERHNRVNILIYGQSIVASSGFNEEVKTILNKKFPEANIHVENRAIGGFTADHLVRTAVHDLYPAYADLIIFHVYGGERTGELEEIFSNVRRYTTSDVLLMNHHINAAQTKSEENQANYLRYIASRYDLELADIARDWPQYLSENHLKPTDLLRDGVHPNRNGNWLLARLVCRHICYNPLFPAVWYKNVRRYEAVTALDQGFPNPITLSGKDWRTDNGAIVSISKESTLKFSFTGNRVDINWGHPIQLKTAGSIKLLLDGKPVQISNTVFVLTRPSTGAGTWWPAIRQVSYVKPLISEDWKLKVYEISADSTVFKYHVSGSVTGADGDGISTELFISRSGRVVIRPDDIMFTRIRKTFRVATPNGFEVMWSAIPLYQPVYRASLGSDRSKEYQTTLLQGISNGPHTLEIIPAGDGPVPVASFEVFEPPLK